MYNSYEKECCSRIIYDNTWSIPQFHTSIDHHPQPWKPPLQSSNTTLTTTTTNQPKTAQITSNTMLNNSPKSEKMWVVDLNKRICEIKFRLIHHPKSLQKQSKDRKIDINLRDKMWLAKKSESNIAHCIAWCYATKY
ncbi:hypothetical protein RND81_11G042700 [Saponaria officinalis]|uniref:Uncharacterized protein n=1 Tax=Saponaria officinalis TaxID=3572 RepID=A0AAW1HI10_SAPOF